MCVTRTTVTSTSAVNGRGNGVMESMTGFITKRLKLKVNQAKSAVARPWNRKFLGFSFTSGREPRCVLLRRLCPNAGSGSGD